MRHFMYVPFTGLGLYGGFRGNRWLRNRIKIFKQFVVPSLLNQTDQDFTIWVSWRRQERGNKHVVELEDFLKRNFEPSRVIFTYAGVCFWDDKYEPSEAHNRLIDSLHQSIGELIDHVGDVDHVLMTIQPSDDCYDEQAVWEFKKILNNDLYWAAGFTKGYIMNYQTRELKEYNPKTNPPFFTIKFKKEVFIDPFRHMQHTGPYMSHEYVPNYLKYKNIDRRGFLVGTHGENISTVFNHPYAQDRQTDDILVKFGLHKTEPLKIRYSLRKAFMRRLPHGWQRKLRYLLGERFFAVIYKFLRS